MRIFPIVAGMGAGVVLAAGGLAGLDFATQPADAQGGDTLTKGDLAAANQRASAAINGYKNLNNGLGKYVAEPGELIGAKSGPIRQDRGVGGGLPTEAIGDDAITEPKLSPDVRAKLAQGGAVGPPGPPGPPGPAAALENFAVMGPSTEIAAMSFGSTTASCPAGALLTGGGYTAPQNADVHVTDARPSSTGATAYLATVINDLGAPISVRAYAICIR